MTVQFPFHIRFTAFVCHSSDLKSVVLNWSKFITNFAFRKISTCLRHECTERKRLNFAYFIWVYNLLKRNTPFVYLVWGTCLHKKCNLTHGDFGRGDRLFSNDMVVARRCISFEWFSLCVSHLHIHFVYHIHSKTVWNVLSIHRRKL